MKPGMTSRERFLAAMRNQVPDRVPCVPDISNMIPCRLTGLPFWDIYLNGKIPLWRAYRKAVEHFGIDAWYQYSRLDFLYNHPVVEREVSRTEGGGRIVVDYEVETGAGTLKKQVTYYLADSPTVTRKPIVDIAAQLEQFKALYPEAIGFDAASAIEQKREVGPDYAFGTIVGFPGFQSWFGEVAGGVEPLAFSFYDDPAALDEIREVQERAILREVSMIIDSGLYDFVLLGGSGSITLASPELFDRYALPTIGKACAMLEAAGIPTMLHSCGKERHVLEACARETALNCINPLEEPPMGDITLAEAKREFGSRLSLMGNLHTTAVMLMGSPEDVTAAAEKAIADAGKGGGFILSTGDQCGRDTPDANMFALVEAAERFGRY
jgi:uroporphyrinogen decarboxylase